MTIYNENELKRVTEMLSSRQATADHLQYWNEEWKKRNSNIDSETERSKESQKRKAFIGQYQDQVFRKPELVRSLENKAQGIL